jgi:hypothetical protein
MGLRQFTGIKHEEGIAEDCLLTTFCSCCQIAQEVTEVGRFFPAKPKPAAE